MSLLVPYTSPQLTLIRSGAYSGSYYLTLCQNQVVFSGVISSIQVGGQSWAFFNYDSVVSGSKDDVLPDMAILISPTSDKMDAIWRGRIRYDGVNHTGATTTTVYVNENSTDIPADYYFFVLNTYDPTYKLSRMDMNNVENIDYNWPYQPDPPIDPDLRTAYVDNVDPLTGYYTVDFDASNAYFTDGHAIGAITCQWIFNEGTFSGLTTSVDFAPGQQWGRQILTDANGTSWTRHIFIAAHDTDNPPDLYFDSLDIREDNFAAGWNLRAKAFAGVDSVMNDTFGVVWRADEQFGGAATDLFPNTIVFIGWVQREEDNLTPDATYSVLSDATFELTGIAARMGRLFAQNIPMLTATSPAKWGDIYNLCPWRAIVHFMAYYSTFANLFGLSFSDTSETYLFPTIVTPGDNLWGVVQGMADQIRANVETTFDGRIGVNIDAGQWTAVQRVSPAVVAHFTAADFIAPGGVKRSIEPSKNTGIVDGDGAVYNYQTGSVTEYTARAPGFAMGDGQGRASIPNQILYNDPDATVGLTDLRQRVGNHLEIMNMTEVLTVQFRDSWVGLIPTRAQVFTVTLDNTIAGANGVNRIVYDSSIYWLLESVSYTTEGDGKIKVEGRLRRLPRLGDPGDDTTPIDPGTQPVTLPDVTLPAFNFDLPNLTIPDEGLTPTQANPASLTPAPGKVAKLNGEELLGYSGTNLYWLRNVITLTTPPSRDITPTDLGEFTIRAARVSPFLTATAIPAVALADDTTDSAMWRSTNAALNPPVWTKGATFGDVYQVLRMTNLAGGVLAYTPVGGAGTVTQTYDFTTGEHGWTIHTGDTTPAEEGKYTAGTGFETINFYSNPFPFNRQSDCYIGFPLPGGTLTHIKAYMNYTPGNGTSHSFTLYFNGSAIAQITTLNAGLNTLEWSGTHTGSVSVDVDLNAGARSDSVDPTDTGVITRVELTYSAGDGAAVVYSDDYGVTVSVPQPVGTALANGVGGFDAQRAGTNSFAGATNEVYRATTLGGTYTLYYTITGTADPVCIIIPYRRWDGSKNTNATYPDIIVALNAADGSGRTLLWIEGGATAGTVHDITPTGTPIFDNSDAVTAHYAHHIACFGKISGNYHLFTTTNKGTTWTDRGTITGPTFIRCRRNDTSGSTSGTNRGQLYLCRGSVIDYSSYWAGGGGPNAGMWPRYMPTALTGFDTVF